MSVIYMLKMSSKWVNVAVSYKRLKMMIIVVLHDFRPVTICRRCRDIGPFFWSFGKIPNALV